MIEDNPRAWRRTVADVYTDEVEHFYESGGAILDESLHPRRREQFFDIAATFGLAEARTALDIGCRDARHLAEVEDRFDCSVVGVELSSGNLRRMHRRFPGRRFQVVQGAAEALPLRDAMFDFVWIRDVLLHVAPLSDAFTECARVMRPGATVLLHNVSATDQLDPKEARHLWQLNAVVGRNMERAYFEGAVHDAGFRIEHREELGGEWFEAFDEETPGGSQRLLRVSRLLRAPAHYRAILGDQIYDIELGNALWGVYQLLGKLTASLYALRLA